MTKEKALAKIAKAYLRQNESKTYDLRDFEYWSGKECVTKVDSLLRVVDESLLEEEELEAFKILQSHKRIVNNIEYTKELVSR